MLFTDNMMLPLTSSIPYAAETMMNYVFDPRGRSDDLRVRQLLSRSRACARSSRRSAPELAETQLIFPPDDVRRGSDYPTFSTAQEQTLNEAMAKVTGA